VINKVFLSLKPVSLENIKILPEELVKNARKVMLVHKFRED
jgi:hypothetical protein